MTAFTIGIDVGGTFTDLVAIDERGTTVVREIALHAAGPVDRRARRPRRAGAQARPVAQRDARADAAHRARRHGRDQRAARAQGRPRRPAHHRRPPRRAGDARGPEGRPLRPALAAARAAGAARPAARRARTAARRRLGADAARRGIARRRDRDHQAVRRDVRRDLLPARLSQSRATRSRPSSGCAARCRTCSSRCRATCCRRSRSSSASRPRSSTPMSGPRCIAT